MNWPNHIHPDEFEQPERLHPELVDALGEVREALGKPMQFSRSRSGVAFHPEGDAVAATADAHSTASLHRYDVNHVQSAIDGRVVQQPGSLCRAADWDAGATTPDQLFDDYLAVEACNRFCGIGLYPFWNRPGLHTDVRPRAHPSYGARWFRDQNGNYHRLTWANWQQFVIS